MVTWAFIFHSPGCKPERDRTEMMHCGNKLLVYGVETVEEGCKVAKMLRETTDCSLIELCGGFHKEGAVAMKKAAGPNISVGYVVELEEQA